MADSKRRRTAGPTGSTFGNVAYSLDYYGDVAAAPAPRYAPPQPRTEPREVPKRAPQVKPRGPRAQPVAGSGPGAAGGGPLCDSGLPGRRRHRGGAADGLYPAQQRICRELAQLRSQLTELENAGVNLEARYEETFDIQTLEQAVAADGTLSYPTSEQSVYIDLSEPDNAVVYDNTEGTGGITGFFQAVGELIAAAVEYFR